MTKWIFGHVNLYSRNECVFFSQNFTIIHEYFADMKSKCLTNSLDLRRGPMFSSGSKLFSFKFTNLPLLSRQSVKISWYPRQPEPSLTPSWREMSFYNLYTDNIGPGQRAPRCSLFISKVFFVLYCAFQKPMKMYFQRSYFHFSPNQAQTHLDH